jgi:methyl-accepting chemotaxis protein
MVMTTAAASAAAPAPGGASPLSWWEDRGVRTKVLTAVGIGAVAATTMGVLGITALNSAAATSSDLYQHHLMAVSNVGSLVGATQAARIDSRDALLTPDPRGRINCSPGSRAIRAPSTRWPSPT